jgi:hypothetical protein
LAGDLVLGSLVSKLCNELVGLDVDVLFASWGFWCFDISCEEFFSGLGTLLFDSLGVILLFVGTEELVWVRARGDNHGSMC